MNGSALNFADLLFAHVHFHPMTTLRMDKVGHVTSDTGPSCLSACNIKNIETLKSWEWAWGQGYYSPTSVVVGGGISTLLLSDFQALFSNLGWQLLYFLEISLYLKFLLPLATYISKLIPINATLEISLHDKRINKDIVCARALYVHANTGFFE